MPIEISVIIPHKDTLKYLSNLLDTVNYTGQSVEIIVVDDNDEDSEYREETEEFMEKYSDVDNLVYLKHKKKC